MGLRDLPIAWEEFWAQEAATLLHGSAPSETYLYLSIYWVMPSAHSLLQASLKM